MQVGGFDQQIGLSHGQTRGDLLQIDGPRHFRLDASLCLVKNRAMLDKIVLGQAQKLPVTQDIVISAHRFKCHTLRGVKKLEQTHQPRMVKPLDVVARGKAVVKQLGDGQGR